MVVALSICKYLQPCRQGWLMRPGLTGSSGTVLANLHRIELHIEFRRIPLTKRRFSAERILRAGVPTPSSFGTETQISCARAWKQFNKPLPCSLGALPHKR